MFACHSAIPAALARSAVCNYNGRISATPLPGAAFYGLVWTHDLGFLYPSALLCILPSAATYPWPAPLVGPSSAIILRLKPTVASVVSRPVSDCVLLATFCTRSSFSLWSRLPCGQTSHPHPTGAVWTLPSLLPLPLPHPLCGGPVLGCSAPWVNRLAPPVLQHLCRFHPGGPRPRRT